MRFILFLMLSGVFQTIASVSYSQSTKITLKSETLSLVDVLSRIEDQSEYRFVYDKSQLDLDKKVKVNFDEASVTKILETIFRDERIGYQILGSQVILRHSTSDSFQQLKTISGKVTDSSGLSLPGVTIIIGGTTEGTITDADGRYSLSDVPPDATLLFSFVGMVPQEISVKGKTAINVEMREDAIGIEEVIAVGYGTQKKANLTGAVDHITNEALAGRANSNVTQMLQGAIPNLNLALADGKPNRSASFNIRGATSIGQGGSALVLIDGVEGNPSMLNPDDIESVSVLKDAAASAIYGSRAPYGVVLITTKKAKKGQTQLNYSTNLTVESPTNTPDFVSDGYTYAEHFYKAYYNYRHSDPSSINKSQQFSTAWLAEYKKRKEEGNFGTIVSDGSWGLTKGRWVYFPEKVDYMGTLYKDHVFTQTHNLSLSGSDDKFDYYLSARYYNYGGLFNSPNNSDDYTMLNTRIKVGYQIYDWMKITDNVDMSRTNYHNPVTYSEGDGNVWRNLADEGHPSSPIWNPDGTMTYSGVYSIGDLLYGKSRRIYKNDYVRNTIGINTNFFENKLRINGDFTYRNENYNRQIKRVRTPYSRAEGVTETISGTQSYISEKVSSTVYFSTNEYAEYENTFGKKHYVKALVGYNYEESQEQGMYAYNDDLLTEDVDNINLAMGADNKNIEGSWTKWRAVGGFFRLNYIFDDRYLLEVDGRYDGSSKFPGNQRWAFFPSASAAWRLTSEPWFKVDPDYLSNLKLRLSYGSLGNSSVSPYSYDETFSFDRSRIIDGAIARYTAAPSPIPIGLTWETARTGNVGIDIGAINNKLSITADFYNRKTINMYTVGPTLPDVYGSSSPKGNYADMTTKGYEVSVTWNHSFNLLNKPFHYNVRATLADYQSTIDKYNNSAGSLGTSNSPDYYAGMKVGEIWGFTSHGLWQTEDEINIAEEKANSAGQAYYNPIMQTDTKYKLYPGDIKFEDLNGNGYIDRGANTVDDPGDRQIIGNSDPRYIYSFKLGADWNRIFFSAFIRGVGKQSWYPSNDASFFWGQYNRPYNQLPKWQLGNYWTEDNRDAYLPRYTGYYAPLYKGSSNANTRYLQDASYVRLQNLQIGYNLRSVLIKKLGLSKATVFLSGENLWTWSPMYKHTRDVDVTNIYSSDVDLGDGRGDAYNYPTMKSYSLGLNVTF